MASLKLSQIYGERAKIFFGTSNIKGRERLLDLGIIIATDTFLNFPLRFPGLTETTKTPAESVLVSYNVNKVALPSALDDKKNPYIELNDLYFISTKCTSFLDPIDGIAYLNQLEKFIDKICMDLKKIQKEETDLKDCTFTSIASIKNCFRNWFGEEPTNLAYLEICLGIIIGYYNIANMGFDRVQRIYCNIKEMAFLDNRLEWEKSLDSEIKIDFIRETIELINFHLMQNVDVIAWALKLVNSSKTIEDFDIINEITVSTKIEIDPTFDLELKLKKDEQEENEKLYGENKKSSREMEEEMKKRAQMLLQDAENDNDEEIKNQGNIENGENQENQMQNEGAPEINILPAEPENEQQNLHVINEENSQEIAKEGLNDQIIDETQNAEGDIRGEKKSSCCTIF